MRNLMLGGALALVATAAGAENTMVGIDHIGLSVPDLAQAVTFFTEVLGCEQVFALGPFADPSGHFMDGQLGAAQDSSLNIATMRCGSSANVELFGFEGAGRDTDWPARDDVGSASIGFYVTDLDAQIAHLRAHGVELLGSVVSVDAGPIAGRRWIYARAPFGLQVFFMSEPDGIAWDQETGVPHPNSLRD